MDRLKKILTKYEDLFMHINELDDDIDILCGELSLDSVCKTDDDPKNYCGCDVTGKQNVHILFYRECDYFVGIWTGDRDDNIDTASVHVMDFSDDNNASPSCGNVRDYITNLMECYIKTKPTNKKYLLQVKQLILDMRVLPDKCDRENDYVLKIND